MRPRPVCPARPATERRASRRSLAMLAHPALLPPRSRCTHAPPVSRCTQPHGALGPDVLLMRGSLAVRAPWLAPGLPVFKLGPPLSDVDEGGAAETVVPRASKCRSEAATTRHRRPPSMLPVPQRRPHVLWRTSNTHSGRRGPRDSPSQCVPHRRSTPPSSGGEPPNGTHLPPPVGTPGSTYRPRADSNLPVIPHATMGGSTGMRDPGEGRRCPACGEPVRINPHKPAT